MTLSPGKVSAASDPVSLMPESGLRGEKGRGWSEDMLEGMRIRVVFERPETAEAWRWGWIWVEMRVRMLRPRVLFTD